MKNSFMFPRMVCSVAVLISCFVGFTWKAPQANATPAEESPLKLLFLGDQKGHQPATRFEILGPVLADRGIELTYTENVNDLNQQKLNQYDGLFLYANIDTISDAQADALLEYVANGHGFVPVHCATYCFRNSDDIVNLMGAQFKRHGAAVMTAVSAGVEHPIMDGYKGFSSWDETYVHHLHNDKSRTVLQYREGGVQAAGNVREPWTWVRHHGKGRVFYTAWGHDERTWNQPGFHDLLERGIRWACGQDLAVLIADTKTKTLPRLNKLPKDLKPFQYVDVGNKIPNYPAGTKRGVQKEPLSLMQRPVPSEESMKHAVVPEGLHLEVFADESMLGGKMFGGKPIAMNWDAEGRLWICETVDYPNELKDADQGRDRVRVIEDTDGDNVADRSTVFADRLSIPTAIAFHRGGAIVQNGTETLYLKDTNGDGKADVRKILISNWQLIDTHGGVSNFRNGLDNWIWAMQGYNNSEPVINGIKQPGFRMGFFRFKLSQDDDPVVEQLEFIRSTTNNTWGLGISEEGLIFGSTANRAPSFFMPIPNRYYERVKGWAPERLQMICPDHLFDPITDKVRQVDHHGGYTAGAGHALYTARQYPKAYWNRTAFVCGPTGKLVGTFVIEKDGAGMKSHSPTNLFASNDEWTAPIMAEVGPDGNVWVLDWYNYIVQHNPTPRGFETGKGRAYETELRDKKYGRIYRVVPDKSKKIASTLGKVTANANGGSIATLQSPHFDMKRGDEVMLSTKNKDKPEALDDQAIAEIHKVVYQQAAKERDVLDADPAIRLIRELSSPTMLVRLHAQRLLVERGKLDVVSELVSLVGDASTDDIGLNTAAIHALQTLAGLDAIESEGLVFEAVVGALKHPSAGVRRNAIAVLPDSSHVLQAMLTANVLADDDGQVILAALLKIADLDQADAGDALAEAVTQPKITSDRWLLDALTSASAVHADQFLAAILRSDESIAESATMVLNRVAEHFARSKPSVDSMNTLLSAMADSQAVKAEAVIQGLSSGWGRDQNLVLDESQNENLRKIFQLVRDSNKASLAQMAAGWGNMSLEKELEPIIKSLVAGVQDSKRPVTDRLKVASDLIRLAPKRKQSVDQLQALIGPQSAVDLSTGLVAVLNQSQVDDLAKRFIELNESATPALRDAVVQAMLSRPTLTSALLASIGEGDLLMADLSADQRSRLTSHPDRQIRRNAQRLMKAGGVAVNNDRAKLVKAKMSLTKQTGDVAAGKIVFTKNCASCHIFKGEGKIVGPNLNGMSVHPKAELLTHILDPNRSVEANYRQYTVVTLDGLVVSGLLAAESLTTIEVIDSQGKKQTILREEIEELLPSKKSVMPVGLEQTIDDQGMVDLLEYLTDSERFVPLGLDSVANVVTTQGMFYDRNSKLERLNLQKWGLQEVDGVPFSLIDPLGAKRSNAIMLHGPVGPFAPKQPKLVEVRCRTAASMIHLLGGVGGWAAQQPGTAGVSMIVRLNYSDGQSEDHPLVNGQHIADYIKLCEVPKSKLAFRTKSGGQVRSIEIKPKRTQSIDTIQLIKPEHRSAPIVMAITVEVAGAKH